VQARIADGFGLSFDHFGRSFQTQNKVLTSISPQPGNDKA